MSVPFIDLRRFEPDFLGRWTTLCQEISAQTQFVGGPRAAALEARLGTLLGVTGVVGCANGTDALQLALRALGVGPGDRVLLPDATFWATFEAVVNCGAQPITVDIDPSDLQMDHALFVEAIERHQPKAAILVHLYGWGSARLDDFRATAREANVHLVEDGAQALGVRWRGRTIYQDATVATISFYPAKVLGACGDAGAVVGADAALLDTVRVLGNHGRTSHYEHGLVGWNSRLAGFDAAFLDLGLDYLDARLVSRRRAADRYREAASTMGIEVIAPPAGYEENAYLNVCLVEAGERPGLIERLAADGIGCGTVYPGAMSEQPGAEGLLLDHVGGDQARSLSRRVVNLPLFAYIRDDEVDQVIEAVTRARG